jgi:hypothetical protein
MLRTALGALVATGIVSVAAPETASALPAVCSSSATNVHTWTDGGLDGNWDTAANWTHGVPNGPNEVACIVGSSVFQDSTGNVNVTVAQLNMDNVTLDIYPGAGVFVDGPAVSVWDINTTVFLDNGRFGGTGRIEMHGEVDITGDAVLTSVDAPGGTAYGGPVGVMEVAPGALLQVNDFGLFLRTRYRIEIDGEMRVNDNTAFVSADYGTATIINGSLQFRGDGGYYRGFPVVGQPLSRLENNGLLAKQVGAPTVVDAWYIQAPTAHVQVNCCTTLALPDDTADTALVQPNHTLATGRCPAQATGICVPTTDPAIDTMSVGLRVPQSDSQVAGAVITLQELTQVPPTTDSRALGNDVYAHADQLAVDPVNPATITLRYSQADVMATPLSDIQIAHISDGGVMTKTPDCVGTPAALPPGAPYCVDRQSMKRTVDNTFITVLTTETSRWRVRRNAPGESFGQTVPGAPQGLVAKLAAPFDGSGISLSWSAPADDGGAAPSAYKIYRDNALLTTTDGATSALIANPGPGEHVFRVSAVNLIGEGSDSSATISIDNLSKPRKVKAVRGKAGGRKTAGAKWKAPADAGGFAITGYKIAVYKANGKKVDTQLLTAAKHKYLFTLKPGRYFFRVRARNSDRWGPWSKPTDLVRPR